MDKFIKLHNSDDNGLIVVNSEAIIAILAYHEKNNRMTSKVYLDNACSLAPFIVNETPAFIVPQDDKDFITLHEIQANEVVIIRKSEISVIDTVPMSNGLGKSSKSKLYFFGNSEMKPTLVHESSEKIMNILNGEVENK